MISKNFLWWLVAFISFVGVILNIMFEQIIISIVLSICFILAVIQYFKYRGEGK